MLAQSLGLKQHAMAPHEHLQWVRDLNPLDIKAAFEDLLKERRALDAVQAAREGAALAKYEVLFTALPAEEALEKARDLVRDARAQLERVRARGDVLYLNYFNAASSVEANLEDAISEQNRQLEAQVRRERANLRQERSTS